MRILANLIMCPDGTILQSHHRHDFKSHIDENGRYSMVDGGIDYLKRGGEFIEMSIHEGDPFILIRRYICRINKDKDGLGIPVHTPLFQMDIEWLKTLVDWLERNQPDNPYREYYIKEIEWRENEPTSK